MNLFKTSAYSAFSQATTVAVGLISVKIIAASIGPSGVAIQGQFINSTAIIGIFANAAIGIGIVKYLAEYANDQAKQLVVIKTALTLTLVCSLIMAFIPLIGAQWFTKSALKDSQYAPAYWLYGIFLPLISFNAQFSYILNGLKKIPALTIVNIFTSVVNLVMLITLTHKFGVLGVLISSSIVSVLVFCLNCYFFNKYRWFTFKELKPALNYDMVIRLLKFSAMSFTAGFGMPLAQILIRDNLIEKFGITQAGYWQAITRISDFYLTFLTSVLSVYFIPKLSELSNEKLIKKELYAIARFLFPVIIIQAFGIWLCKDLIIHYLLTEKFSPIRNLFHFQLTGDVFKVGGWVLSMILWSKAQTRKYIIIDASFLALLVLCSYIFVSIWGLIGATIGFMVTYFLYFIVMIIVNRRYLL